MHVVLLGTGGGPRPSRLRHPSSQAVVVGDRLIVVDCGNGAALQMVAVGLDPRDITDVLLTHHHIDHSADLAILPMTAWVNGRTDRIDVAGPPPTIATFDALTQAFDEDVRRRRESTGRPDFRSMVSVRDLTEAGVVSSGAGVTITTAVVNHPPFTHALAYRVDSPEGSVVVSGDTTPCAGLIELARGADVLIHEVVHPHAIAEYERGSNAATIGAHLRNNHTMIDQVGAVAAAAGVGSLVLSHLVPHGGLTDEDWISAAGDAFTGPIRCGADLMTIKVDTPVTLPAS